MSRSHRDPPDLVSGVNEVERWRRAAPQLNVCLHRHKVGGRQERSPRMDYLVLHAFSSTSFRRIQLRDLFIGIDR